MAPPLSLAEIMDAYERDALRYERENAPPSPTQMVNQFLDQHLSAIGAPPTNKYYGMDESMRMVPRQQEQLMPGGTRVDERDILSTLMGGIDTGGPKFGIGMIKGGNINTSRADQLLRDARNRSVPVQQGPSGGYTHYQTGPPQNINIQGARAIEEPAVWTQAMQTILPEHSPQEIKVWKFLDPVDPEARKAGHFGDIHARKVGLDRPVDLWEEIQSDYKFDKPPKKSMLHPSSGGDAYRRVYNEAGVPIEYAAPWAPNDRQRISYTPRNENDIQSIFSDMVGHGLYNGIQRTVGRSTFRNALNANNSLYNITLDADTVAKLNDLPTWAKAYVDENYKAWDLAKRTNAHIDQNALSDHGYNNKDSIVATIMDAYHTGDTAGLSPEQNKSLLPVANMAGRVFLNFQPTTGGDAHYALSVNPSARLKLFIDTLHEQKVKLQNYAPAASAATDISYPAWGRENQAEAVIQRLMDEATRSGRIFSMFDLGGQYMRGGTPFSYAYKEAPKRLGLVPELMRVTTQSRSGAGHSPGPLSVKRSFEAALGDPLQYDPSDKLVQALMQGAGVKRLKRPEAFNPSTGDRIKRPIDLYGLDIPILTRPEDIDLAKKMGLWTPTKRQDYWSEARRYSDYVEERKPEHFSQLIDSILRSDDPVAEMERLDIGRGDIARLGGVRTEFTPQQVDQLMQELIQQGYSIAQPGHNIPMDVQARLLWQYDPLAALEYIRNRQGR